MDFAKQRHKLPRLKSDLKDFSALEDIARDIRLGVLPESLKNFRDLEDTARQIRSNKTASDTAPTFLTDYRTKQAESESNLYHQRSEEKKPGFFLNQGCDKKTHETSFFSSQQEQYKQSEFLKNSQKKRSFFEYAFKKMRKSSKKKLYTCDKVVGGAKEHGKLNGNSLYKDQKCAQIMHRYATAKKPSESLKTMAKELTEILGVNISRYQAAYQYQLYRKNVEKLSTDEIKKDEHKSSTTSSKKIQLKIPFKKKQKSPSTSPVSLSGIMKQLSSLQKQTNLISQQQNQLMNFIYQKFGKNDKDIDVMQPKSQGFKDAISFTSEKSDDDAMSWKSAKFEEDALSFTSAKSNHSEKISSLNSSQISSNSQDFDDAHSKFSVDSEETVPSDDANSVSLDRKNNKKVTFKDDNCDYKSKNELDVSENEDSFVDSKSTTEVNKKGQILTDYSIRKNSKLKPMVVVNQNNKWYSYTVKNKRLKSSLYECNLCPRHSKFKSKGIMKNGKFWMHPKHSVMCKPMNKEQVEVLQINRDIREDVAKGYHAQESYTVGYKEALKKSIEKHLPTYENICKSLDRWKAKNYPASKKGKVAEEHKVLINGEKFMIFEDKIVSVFMSDECARTMADCRILVADPTFRTSPQGFMQTLYIHGLVETKNGPEWRPLLMAPIDSKNEEDYLKIVNAIKNKWKELGVHPKFERFHTDYEKALFNAFAELNGVDKMFGCIFHYNKAVLQSIKKCGLFGYYHVKRGKKVPEYKAIKKWVRTIMALPMVPKDDIPILAKELLKIPQPPKGSKVKWPTDELEKFKTYIENEWLSVFQEKDNNKWSFYGLGRTKNTNAAEGFHSGLNKTMPKKPKYKVFLELQKNRFTMNDTRIYQLKNMDIKTKCISIKYKEVAERIEKFEGWLEKQKTMQHTPKSYVNIFRKHCERVSHSLHEIRNKSLQTLKSKKKVSKSYNKESEGEDNESLFSEISDFEISDGEDSEDEKISETADGDTQTGEKSVKKNRGRPKKIKQEAEEDTQTEEKSVKKNRGRPKKIKQEAEEDTKTEEKSVKKNRGRPKKIKQEAEEDTKTEEKSVKKNRGMPKKEENQQDGKRRAFEVPPFVPPSLEEITGALKNLGIPEEYAKRSPLLKAKRGTLVFSNFKTFNKIRGDGNCGYRTLSYFLTGTQEFHWQIRMKVMQYVVQNRDKVWMTDKTYSEYVKSYNTLVRYEKPRGVNETHWASDNDFLGFAKNGRH